MRRLCAVAGAWTLLIGAMTPEAEAQARFRETGTVQAGHYVIWLRGTDAGTVQLFAARGYRDALSRPHALRPEAIDSWLDSVSRLSAVRRAATKEVVVSSNNLSADGTAFERRLGGRLPGVTIRLSTGEIVTMPEVSVSAFSVALAEATRAARELTPVSPAVVASRLAATDGVSSPAAPSPAPAQAAAVTVSGRPAVAVAAKPDTDLVPPVDVAKPVSPPPPVATVTAENPPAVKGQPDKPARRAVATQVPVATRAREPVPAASQPANPLPANSVTENPVPVKPLPVSPVSAAPPLELSTIVPVQVAVKAVLPLSAPVIMVVPVQGPVLADTTLGLPMGDIVIPASILRDRESQAQYCYRELGYRYDSKLSGKLLVRVAIAQNGSVSNVRVVQRNWDGVPASEVESCLRALIRLWTFEAGDPARSAGIKEFSLTFTP